MARLVYLSSARRDLVSIFNHIAREVGSRNTASAFIDKLDKHCQKLASLPGTSGRARPELGSDIRSAARGSYVIFFRYRIDRFEVINVVEGHRDIDALFRGDNN